MTGLKKIFVFPLLLLLGSNSNAQLVQLSLPKIIANSMVLQRGQPVPIWGYAKAGDEVTVSFEKQEKKIITGSDGSWKIILDAMPASATPQQMVIKTTGSTIVLENILIGEVWLCSGQSNMEYAMRKISKLIMPDSVRNWPVHELQTAHNKNIRIFLVDRKKMKPDPAHTGWEVAEDSALRSFSAVGYFFAKKLYEELNVPVAIKR